MLKYSKQIIGFFILEIFCSNPQVIIDCHVVTFSIVIPQFWSIVIGYNSIEVHFGNEYEVS